MYFVQLLIRENVGHACIFIVNDGTQNDFSFLWRFLSSWVLRWLFLPVADP